MTHINRAIYEHLEMFLLKNFDESFRNEYDITDGVIRQKAQKLFSELNEPHEITGKEMYDNSSIGGIIYCLVQKYTGNTDESESYSFNRIREGMILAYLKDGGKVNWFTSYEKSDPRKHLITYDLIEYITSHETNK